MPAPPEGEAELRRLARRFVEVEAAVLGRLAEAAVRDRRSLLRQALELLVGLRRLDLGRPVELAYLAIRPVVRVIARSRYVPPTEAA